MRNRAVDTVVWRPSPVDSEIVRVGAQRLRHERIRQRRLAHARLADEHRDCSRQPRLQRRRRSRCCALRDASLRSRHARYSRMSAWNCASAALGRSDLLTTTMPCDARERGAGEIAIGDVRIGRRLRRDDHGEQREIRGERFGASATVGSREQRATRRHCHDLRDVTARARRRADRDFVAADAGQALAEQLRRQRRTVRRRHDDAPAERFDDARRQFGQRRRALMSALRVAGGARSARAPADGNRRTPSAGGPASASSRCRDTA